MASEDAPVLGQLAHHDTRTEPGRSRLEGKPTEKIRTIAGLTDVIAYLDASRSAI